MNSILPFLTLLATGFWMWMLFECLRKDPERGIWIWVLIFLNIPGAILYFLVRRLPHLNLPMPIWFKQWSHRNQIWEAEAAAKNIGKAHQFINLGNVLLESGQLSKADEAFQQALAQEPKNPHALWGKASVDMSHQKFEAARDTLEKLLEVDSDYKFGEASLAYGQALFALEEWEQAQAHLEKDVKYWSHPEASLMLAKILVQHGEAETAKEQLEQMMFKLKASPRFHYRKKQHLFRQAQRMLNSL